VQLVANTPPQDSAPSTHAKPDRLIRLAELESLVSLKKTTIYELLRAGKFVKPIRLSSRCTAWSYAAVQQWIQDRITEAGAKQ